MSENREAKVQQLVDNLKSYGKPMLIFLQVITWELPSAWAIVFAACSLIYVILYNMSVRTFSVLGLLALWLDYYCCNNIKFQALTQSEIEHLQQICSKLVVFQSKVRETYNERKAASYQNRSNFKRNVCALLLLAIVASWLIDNLLLCYLIGSTALPMVGMFFRHSDFV